MPKKKLTRMESKQVARKIKKIHAEEPDRPMKAVVGKAVGMVKHKAKKKK